MNAPDAVQELQCRLHDLKGPEHLLERIQVLARLARTFYMGRRHPREAKQLALEARHLLGELEHPPLDLQLECQLSVTSSCFHNGEYIETVREGEVALRLLTPHTPPSLSWYLYHKMGAAYINLSFTDLALEHLHLALQHAEKCQHSDPQIIVLVDLGVCYHWSGHPERGLLYLERAAQLPEPITPFRKSLMYNQLAGVYLAVGRLQDTAHTLDLAFAHMEHAGDHEFRPALLATRANLLLEEGRLEESQACLMEFQDPRADTEQDVPRLELLNATELAKLCLHMGDLQGARLHTERCLEIARKMSMEDQVLACCEQLGTLLDQLGEYEQAMHYEREARNILKNIYAERTRRTIELYEVRMEARTARTALEVSQQQNTELQQALQKLEQAQQELVLKTRKLEERNLQIQELSVRDPLTGLYNRRLLTDRLEEHFCTAQRYQQPLSVMMLDIDHFKSINDQHGHAMGDEVLKVVAMLLTQTVRGSDLVARYGGEEFVVVMPYTDLDRAGHVAERIRQTIEGYPWEAMVPGLNVTISAGVSENTHTRHHERLLQQADSALYTAKRSGRNRVIVNPL